MGAFSGIINFFIAAWFFVTASARNESPIKWGAIGAGTYLACSFAGYLLVLALQSMAGEDTSVMSPSGGFGGSDVVDYGSAVVGIFYELLPIILGLLGSAFVRARFLLKTGLLNSLSSFAGD